MPRRAWRDIALRTYKRTWDDNVGLVAAGVAFYSFFGLLSLLGLIVLTYGFVADPHDAIKNMQSLTTVLPRDVASVIGDQLMTAVKSSEGTKGLAIILAFLVAVYGGTNGAAAVITAMNIAYEEKEKRSLLVFYFIAFSMTLAALVTTLLALGAVAGLAAIQKLYPWASTPTVVAGRAIGYLFVTLFAAAVASSLYRFGPSRENARWRWITPGSMFAAVMLLLLTIAFGYYVVWFADYSRSYGSFGTIVALLSWMYLCAYAFIFGAELNSEIEHQTAKDSTTGRPRPLGERGAWAADNVAVDETVQDRPEEAREGEKLTQAAPTIAEEEG